MGEESINITASQALHQASCVLASRSEQSHDFPRVTTVKGTLTTVTEVLRLDGTNMAPLILTRPKTKEQSAALKKLALETFKRPSDRMIYRTPPGHAPPPVPASKEAREAIRRMALQMTGSQKPYMLSLYPQIAEGYLPSLVGCTFEIAGVDADEFSRRCQIQPDNVYFDTGAHTSYITDDLLPSEFKHYLTGELHNPYHNADGITVQVEANVRFSNTDKEISFPATVVSASSTPNGFSGVLLGQHGLINRIRYESIPAIVLDKLARPAAPNVWGEIRFISMVDLDDVLATL